MLTYADVCWSMLAYAGVCWRMLTYGDALMLASLHAGAKWVCTGTPAPSTPAAELQHMYGLVAALSVQPYANADTWRTLIHAPFESQVWLLAYADVC